MEALNLLKFWTPIFTFTTLTSINLSNLIDEEEEEDSFFELELTVPDLDTKKNNPDNVICESDLKASKPTVSLSLRDHFSKRRIIPIEPNFKPQSPISLLKSAPRFRVLWFKKSKSRKTEETEFNREKTGSQNQIFPGVSSKRFSKEVIGKYLKLIKPLHVKISKRMGKKMRFSGELSSVSSRKEKQGNTPAGIWVSCKHLGKSKSASAAIGVTSPARRDDSLLLQHDGIQSAILHCKRSFNSSDSSWLSMDSTRNSNEEANGFGI